MNIGELLTFAVLFRPVDKELKGENLFRSAMALMGQMEIGKIHTQPQRLFALSWAFWVLIMTSAYTANLASFFVSKNLANMQIVVTVQDAIAFEKNICVWKSSATEGLLKDAFPSAKLVLGDSQLDTFQDLQAGRCDVLATGYTQWGIQRHNEEVDGDCLLNWNGIVQNERQGGMATTADSHCSSVISQVIDIHFNEMNRDGRVAQIWDTYTKLTYAGTCPSHRPLQRSYWALGTSSDASGSSQSRQDTISLR